MNIEEQLSFLKKLLAMAELGQLVDGTISIGEYEVEKLREIINSLERSRSENTVKPNIRASKLPAGFFDSPLALTNKDLAGLPDELLSELNDLDETEVEILELFEMSGGTLILDKIIAGLFHLTGKSHSRHNLTAKIYRMSKKGLIRSVPKKKGVYTTDKEDDLT